VQREQRLIYKGTQLKLLRFRRKLFETLLNSAANSSVQSN